MIIFLPISRDAIFMMVVVSWTFSSQSRLNLSQQFHCILVSGFRDLCYGPVLVHFVSIRPSFSFSMLFFISLDI